MKNKDLIFSFKEKFLIKSTDNFINKNYVHFSSNFSPSYRDFYLSVFESLDYFFKRELVENYNAKDIKFPISIDLNDGEKTKILKKSEKIIRII